MSTESSVEEQRAFYDRWNLCARNCAFDEVSKEIRLRGAKVIDFLRALNLVSSRILEVGCGTGWLAEKLCDLGEVEAIDLSPSAIDVALKRNLPARFIAGDFYEYDFPGASFDVAVCAETLFYVFDQPRFVAKLAALIKHEGYLVVTTINKFVYDRSRDIAPPENGQIRNWLSRREVKRLLSSHFDILSVSTMEPRGDMGILRFVNSIKLNLISP